jgi:hypothetical protein
MINESTAPLEASDPSDPDEAGGDDDHDDDDD